MIEYWKPSRNRYQVSSLGRVRNSRGRLLKLRSLPDGRIYAQLRRGDGLQESVGIHVLVCEAFHGPKPSPDLDVAHRDCDNANNVPENLRWATRAENVADCIRNGCRH